MSALTGTLTALNTFSKGLPGLPYNNDVSTYAALSCGQTSLYFISIALAITIWICRDLPLPVNTTLTVVGLTLALLAISSILIPRSMSRALIWLEVKEDLHGH